MNIEMPSTLGERIRLLRVVARMTQKQLAKACRLSQSTIAQIETNKKLPGLITLSSIAGGLNTKAEHLITGINF